MSQFLEMTTCNDQTTYVKAGQIVQVSPIDYLGYSASAVHLKGGRQLDVKHDPKEIMEAIAGGLGMILGPNIVTVGAVESSLTPGGFDNMNGTFGEPVVGSGYGFSGTNQRPSFTVFNVNDPTLHPSYPTPPKGQTRET
jgi:hypothetical protein